MSIILDIKHLTSRLNRLSQILKPIIKDGSRVGGRRYPRGRHEFILYANPQNSSSQHIQTSDFRNVLFPTFNSTFKANYFEIWNFETKSSFRAKDNWRMKSGYLNIFYNSKNVLSLHCEPDEEEPQVKNSPHFEYKIGPHLHIKDPCNLFSDAHIALNLGDLNSVISDMENLNVALIRGIKMIHDQFLIQS